MRVTSRRSLIGSLVDPFCFLWKPFTVLSLRNYSYSFVVFSLTLSTSWAQAGTKCLEIETATKAISSGRKKSRTKIRLLKGEVLPFVTLNRTTKKYAKITVGLKTYWIPKSKATLPSEDQCQPSSCVNLTQEDAAFENPSSYETFEVAEGEYQVLSSAEFDGTSWYRVAVDESSLWINEDVFESRQTSCSSASDVSETETSRTEESEESEESDSGETSTPASEKSRTWRYGLEAGFGSVSSSPVAGSVTPAPPTNVDVNDDAFDSPFIDNVNDGQGFFLGGFVEIPFLSSWAGRISAGYGERNMSQTIRENPHRTTPSFVTYPELPQSTNSLEFRYLYLAVFPNYSFDLLSVNWRVGLSLKFQYHLDENFNQFRTGPQKLVAYSREVGYEEFEMELSPRFEGHLFDWMFVFIELNNRVSPEVDFQLAPQLGLGFQL